ICQFSFSIIHRKTMSTLFPYTTLFRSDGMDILKKSEEHFDTVYIDPARRLNTKKGFLLQDCQPDILEYRQTLLGKSKQVIIKTSDRKSTRLNSSHVKISYAVFCLKKKS